MNKCVVFDLDGTLLNTLPDIVGALNILLEKRGLRKLKQKEVLPFICFGAKRLIEDSLNYASQNPEYSKNLGEQGVQKALSEYVEIYAKRCAVDTVFYEGIEQLLFRLKDDGYKLAVFTNKTDTVTQQIAKVFFKEGLFDMIVGQRENIPCKPNKDGLIYILNRLEVNAENAVMVGDGETDYQTYVNANCKGVCVLWGYRDKQTLESFGATNFVEDTTQLYHQIKTLLK